jgi:hypothetical protein
MIRECASDIDDARVSPLDACCRDWSHRKAAQRVYSNMAPITWADLGGTAKLPFLSGLAPRSVCYRSAGLVVRNALIVVLRTKCFVRFWRRRQACRS